MGRTVLLVVLVVCLFGVNCMPGKRARRGFNNNGYGSERGGGGGGGSGGHNHGSDERDASVSREEGGCGGDNYENRESSYGRDGYNTNERRHIGRLR